MRFLISEAPLRDANTAFRGHFVQKKTTPQDGHTLRYNTEWTGGPEDGHTFRSFFFGRTLRNGLQSSSHFYRGESLK